MNQFKAIRERLGMTQAEIAAPLQVSQGNISFYERGQTIPPVVAKRVIELAASKGLVISYDHVYGEADLPAKAEAKNEHAPSEHARAVEPLENRDAADPGVWPLQRENRLMPRREGPSSSGDR